ncbi:amidohydrolase [Bifidobacterium goeldii]|uniref:Amidohydrolase n=1 Tax=Bifidobacterium goeldii TaxID=2306975 RepID=A0A430FHD2_9BIFI|nr:amidohydrolase family protein [Bifidobacterium goeldii]RSX52172.1 amidohydrolase [Bifidobacterium goeldii]
MADSQVCQQVRQHIMQMPLVDDHVHSCLAQTPSRPRFEELLCECAKPLGPGQSRFDSQAGFALVRYCSPLLFGERCAVADYYDQRAGVDEETADRTLLPAAGVGDWIIDPGWAATELIDSDEFARRCGGRVHLLTRLETVAEQLLQDAGAVHDFPQAFRRALHEAAANNVGFKTICAYRCGFDIDWRKPSDTAVQQAVDALDAHGRERLVDPQIVSFIVHEAMAFHKPIQFHVGLGDRDIDFRHSNPLDLRDLLVAAENVGTPVVLLHCWPFERECGYLCQNFNNVYMDVGLASYLMGVQAVDALRRALELCPFTRLMYSSDAWGLPEQHYFGAMVFRRAFADLVEQWVADGDWLPADAIRVADLVAAGNAKRLYRLS